MTSFDRHTLAAQLLHHFGHGLKPGDSVVPSIVPTAVFHLPGDPANAPYQYGRFHNPTCEALESALGLLEGAETVGFPSGMAAISAILFVSLKAGDRVLLPSDGYYTTRVLAEKYLKPFDVEIVTRPTAGFMDGDFDGFRLVFAETPSNPGLDVCDIAAIASKTRRPGTTFIVDNTTMTPLGQRPLSLGADVVVNSDTKAVNGHSDVLMGHVSSHNGEIIKSLREWRRYAGAVVGPFEAWQVLRGLETLEVRLARMCETASVIAERLSSHRKVASVRYPGLASDPAFPVAQRQMMLPGSMITLTLAGQSTAERFISECAFIQPSTSFGGIRTCAERRARWGDAVPDGLVRLSIGVEPLDPLWKAIDKSLNLL